MLFISLTWAQITLSGKDSAFSEDKLTGWFAQGQSRWKGGGYSMGI